MLIWSSAPNGSSRVRFWDYTRPDLKEKRKGP